MMRRYVLLGLAACVLGMSAPDSLAQQPTDKQPPGQNQPVGRPVPDRPGPGENQRPPRPSRPPPVRPGVGRPTPPRLPPSYARHLARHRYRLGAYQRPSGYYARQWDVGMTLPAFFRAQTYWLTAASYGLRPPPPGAQWIRVDNDAVLVSSGSGQVIDIVYGVFY